MASNTNKWNLGEIVYPPRTTKLLKSSSAKLYERLIDSRYICIREATEGQYCILLRVLGKVKANHIMFVNGQPFCEDDAVQLFEDMSYFSYSFPTVAELTEVLDIIRSNPSLLTNFEAASMHFNPKSLFWVNETTNHLLFMKKPLCYNASTENLSTASDDIVPYRLTMVYFNTQLQIVEPVDVEPVMSGSVVPEPTVAEPEKKESDGKWKKRVLPIIFCLAVLFVGGYLIGKYVSSQNEIDPENVEKDAKTPVKEIVPSKHEDSLLEPGQEIKIPKLELKKKKPQAQE